MKAVYKIKILPVLLILLIIVLIVLITFNTSNSNVNNTDTSTQINDLTPLVKTIEIADGKTESIKGSKVTLPENYSFISIINERIYRGFSCTTADCLLYLVDGERDFIISNSQIENPTSSKTSEDIVINLKNADYTFKAIIYYGTLADGSDNPEDKRYSFVSGCINSICFASDVMNTLDKDTNAVEFEQFKTFINQTIIE